MNYKTYFDTHQKSILDDFFTYLRFKTISSEPGYDDEMEKCIKWLKSYLEPLDFKVHIWRSHAHPVVFAESPHIPGAPTLLIYNHYDVQPVDPLEEWESPPFEPTIRNEMIFARGANDNKGQNIYVLSALKAYKEIHGKFPINIKLVIEGDEEHGSAGLNKLIHEKQKELQADYLAIVDLWILSREQPSLTFGIRGLICFDLVVEGPNHDMHSGSEGGVVLNPIHALCHLLDSARDKNGKVTIPGFYDGVKPLNQEEKERIHLDFDEQEYLKQHGVLPRGGEKGYSPFERAWIRPTFEVNGISGGYSGNGFKTVIPSKASAKISFRLVEGQDPATVAKLVTDYFEKNSPEGVKVTLRMHPGLGFPVKSKFDSPFTQAVVKSYEEALGKKIVFTFEGGSIPITSELAKVAGADIAFIGLGLPTDLIHAPNEHFDLERIKQGFCIIGHIIENLGAKST